MHPHNLTMTALGTALLWFGWFGFNAGSALSAGTSAVAAFVNTNTAPARPPCRWWLIEWLHKGKATVLGACSAPSPGWWRSRRPPGSSPRWGRWSSACSSACVCYGAILLKGKLGYDDSLDVFGVHGVGGAFGALAVGVLAKAGISGDVSGLLDGNPSSSATRRSRSWRPRRTASSVTFVLLKLVDLVIGLRVTAEEEEIGLDLTQHGERGYIMGVGELMVGGSHGIPERPLPTPVSMPVPEPALFAERH